MNKKKFVNALKKRALGCKVVESVEEYGMVDGTLSLVKQKVTKKDVPPDITAMKMLMDIEGESEPENLDDEQLEQEKMRLIALLKNNDENNSERTAVDNKNS